MNRTLAVICHLTLLVVAALATRSPGGFVVLGLGPALLLDRYALRLLPWGPVLWKRELAVRLGWFLLGAVGFSLIRLGIVPWWEATLRGLVVTLALGLSDSALELIRRPNLRLGMRMGVVAGVVLLSPIIVTLHPLRTVPKRTPAAFDLPFEDVRFHTSDGLELAAWVIPHPEARGTVIFCHGHGTNRGKVAGVLTLMHDLRLNVLAFDFRGHGDSEGHTSTFGYLEVEDLIAADGLARERFPGQPILLAGVSMGAAVTLQALPRLPHVRGVWSEAAFARFGDVVDHFLTWVPPGLHAPLVRTYEGLGWLDCGFRVSAINPVDSLKETRVPIHFCHGMRDGLIPVSEGMELYASYAGPRDCWWAENATHYDVRKRNADEYRRRLRAFVDKCLATPGP